MEFIVRDSRDMASRPLVKGHVSMCLRELSIFCDLMCATLMTTTPPACRVVTLAYVPVPASQRINSRNTSLPLEIGFFCWFIFVLIFFR